MMCFCRLLASLRREERKGLKGHLLGCCRCSPGNALCLLDDSVSSLGAAVWGC